MDHQVQIKQSTYTEDSQGGRTGNVSTVATVWANIMPLAASRALGYGMVMNNKPHEVDMRYEAGLYTLDEDSYLVVVETGQTLYIHSFINVDMKYERAKLLCQEKR